MLNPLCVLFAYIQNMLKSIIGGIRTEEDKVDASCTLGTFRLQTSGPSSGGGNIQSIITPPSLPTASSLRGGERVSPSVLNPTLTEWTQVEGIPIGPHGMVGREYPLASNPVPMESHEKDRSGGPSLPNSRPMDGKSRKRVSMVLNPAQIQM